MNIAKLSGKIIFLMFVIMIYSIDVLFAGVNNDGSFSYSYPINIPAGRSGVQPQISLSYSSNAGNGLVGYGWNISGLGSIKRDSGSSMLETQYSINGTRLIWISDATYKSFINNDAIYTFSGGDWIENKPDGTKYIYGEKLMSSDLGVKEWGLSKVVDIYGNYYTIQYEQDGNMMYPRSIVYTGNDNEGYWDETRRRAVIFNYSARTDIEQYKCPDIVTMNRLLTSVVVDAGSKGNPSESRVCSYDFEYAILEGKSTLKKINERDAAGNLAFSQSFDWITRVDYDNSFGTKEIQSSFEWSKFESYNVDYKNFNDGGWKGKNIQNIDFNGDRYTDIVAIYAKNTVDSIVVLWENSKSNNIYLNPRRIVVEGFHGDLDYIFNFVDINGDNYLDLFAYKDKGGNIACYVYRYDYSSNKYVYVTSWLENKGSPDVYILTGDVNGDERTDISVVYNKMPSSLVKVYSFNEKCEVTTWSKNMTHQLQNYVSDDRYLLEPLTSKYYYYRDEPENYRYSMADFDGDGKSDILRYFICNDSNIARTGFEVFRIGVDNVCIKTFNTGGHWDLGYAGTYENNPKWSFSPVDMNGDGRTDIVAINMGQNGEDDIIIMTYISKGDGTFKEVYKYTEDCQNDEFDVDQGKFSFGDFNGDGNTDIAAATFRGGYKDRMMKVYYTNNLGQIAEIRKHKDPDEPYYDPEDFEQWFIGTNDINSDGQQDIITYGYKKDESGDWFFKAYSHRQPKAKKVLMQTIREKNNVTTMVGYNVRHENTAEYLNADSGLKVVPDRYRKTVVNLLISSYSLNDIKNVPVAKETYLYYDYSKYRKTRGTVLERSMLGFETITEWSSISDTNIPTKTIKNIKYCTNPYLPATPVKIENYIDNAPTPEKITYHNYEIHPTGSYRTIRLMSKNEVNALYGVTSTESYTYDEYGNVTQQLSYAKKDNVPLGETSETSCIYTFDYARYRMNVPARKTEKSGTTLLSDTGYNEYMQGNNTVRVTTVYNSGGSSYFSTKNIFDKYGNVIEAYNPKNAVTRYEYDSGFFQYPVKVANELGHSTETTYDMVTGNKVSQTGPNGYRLNYTYDNLGRQLNITDKNGKVLCENTYEGMTKKTETIHSYNNSTGAENNKSVKTEYLDSFGRAYRTEQNYYSAANMNIVQAVDIEYGMNGKVKAKTLPYIKDVDDPTGKRVSYTYDKYDRVTKIVNPDTRYKSLEYSLEGEGANTYSVLKETTGKTGETDKISTTTKKKLDSSEMKKTDPAGNLLVYQYSKNGYLTAVTGPDGKTTTIDYDFFGRKTSVKDPNAGIYSYEYDVCGNTIQQKDANGNVISMEFDTLDRIKRAYYNKSGDNPKADVEYFYDQGSSKGLLTLVKDNEVGEYKYIYDEKGNATVIDKKINGRSYKFAMDYDTAGRVTAITYPDKTVITREYSDAEFLSAVKWGGHALVKYGKFKIDAQTNIVSNPKNLNKIYRVTGDDVETEIEYDTLTQKPLGVKSVHYKKDKDGNVLSTKILEDVKFGYNWKGNITEIAEAENNANFSYDTLGRIKTATGIYGTLNYEYAASGNLTEKDGKLLKYGDINHPHAVTAIYDKGTPVPSESQMDYDANGNMIRKGNKIFVYDALNRLRTIKDGTKILEQFIYDYQGQRVITKREDNVVTVNIDGLYEINTVPGKEETKTKYIYGIKNEVVTQITDNNSTFLTWYDKGVLEKYYDKDSVSGLLMYGYGYATRIVSSPEYNRAIVKGAMILLIIMFGAMTIWVTTKNTKNTKTQKYTAPLWVKITIPMVMLSFSALTMQGCYMFENETVSGTPPWLAYEDAPNNSPQNAEQQQNSDGTGTGSSAEPTMYEAISEYLFGKPEGSGIITSGIPKTGVLFFHPDYTGNTKFVTDSYGNVRSTMRYKPYGEIFNQSGTDNFRHKFNGKDRDHYTGLYYYGARYYDPEIGRWTSPDPTIPEPGNTQAFNRYSFVCGSPIAFQDEGGYASISGIWDGFVSAVSTVINTISTIGSKIGGAIAKAYDDGQFLAGYCFGKAMENLLISVKNFSEGNISSGLKHFGLFITWGTGGFISSILGVVLSTLALPFAVLSGLEEGVLCSLVDMDKADRISGTNNDHDDMDWPKWVKRLHAVYSFTYNLSSALTIFCLALGSFFMFIFPPIGIILLCAAITFALIAFYTGSRIKGDGAPQVNQMRIGRYHFKKKWKNNDGEYNESVHRDKDDPFILPIGTILHAEDTL